ncbi:unnamed protein product [Rotaria sp. Silwood1]|nr:unnamed protein product [Rotaria sp. Silwood1]CAF1569637.1 unnamed protein product [Rotaria sp. Silwood1]
MMTNREEERDFSDKNLSLNSNLNPVNIESKEGEKKYRLEDIRSIKIYPKNDDEYSSNDENDISDIVYLPEISSIKRKEDKFYQQFLPIGNGIYNGTINKEFLREGQGTYSINNGEEYYSGSWKDDKPDGYGFNLKNHGTIIYYGEFQKGILKEGYGKEQLPNGYEYEGKIKDEKFHGLGSLSIKVSGLTEINQSGIEKDILKLVAEWKEGNIEFIYINDIEQYYINQYESFCNSLESILLLNNNEYQQKQREYLLNFIDLFEKRLSNLNLLNEIVTNPHLPRVLKSSADLLFKLDHSYTNLNKYTKTDTKKNYNDYINNICQRGLKNYARRLSWSEDENNIYCISSKIIFDNSLDNFLIKSQLSDLKEILHFNPYIIDLIKKLIRFANERLIRISSEYRTQFIEIHTKFLQYIWKNYFQNLDYNSIPHRFDYENNEKYYFYSNCYSNLLELSLLYEFEIEIEIESKKLEENSTNSSIIVKLNGENVFHKSLNDNQSNINVIVFDQKIAIKKLERVFNTEKTDLIQFILEDVDPNAIVVFILSYHSMKNLSSDIKNFFKKLGSIRINRLKENMTWVFMKKINDSQIYEDISFNDEQRILIKENFQFKLNENILVDEKINKNHIESIIYKVMKFSLNNFKPWLNIEVKKWSEYLNQPIHQNISIKEIGDKILLKVLQDSKNHILNSLKAKNPFHHIINMNDKYLKQFSEHLESLIVYYQDSLLKDKNFNYQSKMKEIKKIVDYFLQISINKNSKIRDITELQLESIREFIEGKQSITEVIDHFLNFNVEFFKLFQIFQEKFSSELHSEFHKNASKIISLIIDIFKLILQPEKEDTRNYSDVLKKYKVSNLGAALRKSVFEEEMTDIKILLEASADINEQDDESKKTALHCAVERENKYIISYLLEKGANIEIKDKNKLSPVDYAHKYGIDLNSLLYNIQNNKKDNLNKFENKLFAMQKINNFLTNLGSLDMNWFVERQQINNFDPILFKKVGENDIYKVLQINKAKKNVNNPCSHYVLETIIELLEIIKNVKIINQASFIEMIKLRAELIMAIGKSFKYFNDQIKYNSLSKFKEDCVIPFKYVTIDNESYEIFYDKLEKIDLYFLYNRKLKEITLDQALKLFQEKNDTLSGIDKIKNAFLEYEQLFRKYFDDIINKKTSIKHIIEKTKKIANKSNFKKETIPTIIAGLSIVFSLMVSDFIEKHHGEYVLKDKYNRNYLLQPHCIQILGILMLLDIDGNTNSLPPNHLAEILTGQEKSWTLALLGGYFSLIGYQVTVSCYSNYLSRRDENDFKKNLEPFNFTNYVKYRTFETMCDEKLSNKNSNKTLRNIVSDIISGEKLSPINIKKNQEEKSILLIDEVDVFFSHQFGKMYNPVVTIKNKHIAQIQKDIWEYIMTNKSDESQLKTLFETKLFSLIDKDKLLSYLAHSNILKNHLEEMINTALNIHNNINKFKDKFKIIDNVISTKNLDGKYSNIIYQYENSFYYLKLMYEKQESFKEVILNENNFGYIVINCGNISYSELPNSFNGIFGVSESLKDLSDAEESLLKHYNIHKRSYCPSFFGKSKSKLNFNKNNDFIIKNCKKDWFDNIVTNTRKKIAEHRSILIFFKNEKILDEFYNSYSEDLGVIPFFITQNRIFDSKEEKDYSDNNVNKLITDEYAGHHGKVTLLTKEFERGVDFQSETKVNEKGGIHVIQTFFSENIKEEIQIKGRTARKGELGSYELILCLEHLQESEFEGGKTPKYKAITNDTTYDELDSQRKEKTNSFCQDKLKQIEKNQEIHNRTLAFFQKAISECNDENREIFIQEIIQLRS